MTTDTSDDRATESGDAKASPEILVLFRVVNSVAIVTLNRPVALNVLSHEMIVELARVFELCRRQSDIVAVVLRGSGGQAFCAGRDVRALHHAVTHADSSWLQFFIDEYRLGYTIHTFPKPVVALLDGITMGGGMGLGQGAPLRVVTSRTKMAMPETRMGLLPDVGATWFLGSMPVALRLFFGLTGAVLSGPDALLCNLADICVPSEWLETFEERLKSMPVDLGKVELTLALREVFEPPANVVSHAALSQLLPLVTRHFDKRMTVDEMAASIQDALNCIQFPSARRWLETSKEALLTHSPTMLNVTLKALLRGRRLTLADCLRLELDIVSAAVREGDFVEGVRAHLIDKDRRPLWSPPTLGEVRPNRIRYFTASLWSREAHPLADLGRH